MSHGQATKAQDEPRSELAPDAAPLAARNASRSILVVEDNGLNGLLLSEQLRLLDFSAEIAVSGQVALERWRGGSFGLVVTDIQMPGMDGYELASAIRREEGDGTRIPIIALTANAFLDKSARWKAAGIDDYLIKPAELATLKATLNHWLRRPDAGSIAAAAAPARDEPAQPVDLTALALMVGTDPTVHCEFLHAFARSAREATAAIEATMRLGDRKRVAFLAHQLKASAAAIGAIGLARICSTMEAAAGEDEGDALAVAWQLFRAEARVVESWIASRTAQDPVAASSGDRSVA